MGQIWKQNDKIFIKQMFNQQQALHQIQSSLKTNANFNKVYLENVGIKIMKQAFKVFEGRQVSHVQLKYDWNQIMVMPKLVCYDKNTWKTLQQLSNWNRQWNILFENCYNLNSLFAEISISWMNNQFIKQFLEGLAKLPNVQQVHIKARSKDQNVQKMLQAFKNANIFPYFQYKFEKI